MQNYFLKYWFVFLSFSSIIDYHNIHTWINNKYISFCIVTQIIIIIIIIFIIIIQWKEKYI